MFGIWSQIEQNEIFLPQKRRSATFRGDPPFSIAFLWSLSSGFAPNFRNLVRKCNFGNPVPGRLTTLQKNGKIRKQCYQTLFFGLTAFNPQNNCKLHSDQVSRHSITKKYDFGQFFNFWPSPLKLDQGF